MILVTHGLVGGSVALATGNPFLGALAAFASHFVLDAIPHWDYHLPALDESNGPMNIEIERRGLLETYAKVFIDGVLGVLLPVLLAYFAEVPVALVFVGCVFAILPDFLQFVYFKTKTPLLYHFMLFHTLIHSHVRFDKRPVLGIAMQAMFWLLSVVYMVRIW